MVKNYFNEEIEATDVKGIILHGGCFHADDVMCYAMMKVINPNIRFFRITFDKLKDVSSFLSSDFLKHTIVCDVFNTAYDHHDDNVSTRKDGHKRAACGLLFEDIKYDLFESEKYADIFETTFIYPIEDNDNGVSFNPLNAAIRSFNPSWDSSEYDVYDKFIEAAIFLESIINNFIEKSKAEIRAYDYVSFACSASVSNGAKFCILDKSLPWFEAAKDYRIKYAVSPSDRGGWNVSVNRLLEIKFDQYPGNAKYIDKFGRFISFSTKTEAIDFASSLN